ncbi:MAG: hypothetical protein WD733_10685 [Bryobacterales bacterium]
MLLVTLPAPAEQLFTGVDHTVNIPPQTAKKLFNDFTFTVIPTVSKVTIDLVTDDPADDLDLFVQSAQIIVEQEGEIPADFSSESSAGVEQIVIDGTTEPPLETGVYYLAILAKTLGKPISAKLTITVVGGSPPSTFSISTFSQGTAEGWERNYPGSILPGATIGDFAGILTVETDEFLRLADLNGPSQDFVVAPAKFLGNLAVFSPARFEFDYRHSLGAAPLFPIEMRLIGAGSAFRWQGPVPPSDDWVQVEAPLEAGSWSRIAGTGSLQDVLRNLARIELSMDQAPGAETNDLDNFTFIGEPPPPPTGSPTGPTSSLFETDLDNWTRNFPAVGISGSTAGTPDAALSLSSPGFGSESFLLITDPSGSGQDFAVLPDKYLGNLAQLDRPWFEFDYRKIEGGISQYPMQMRLIGGGTVYLWSGARPRSSWEHFRVPLDPDYWVKFQGEAEFAAVLANVERIELSMDVASGPEVNGLDNFYLRTEFTPPAGRALQLNRERVLLTGTSGGPAFPAVPFAISSTGGTVQWTAFVTPVTATWLRVSPGSGETPDNAEILVAPSGLPPGTHIAGVIIRADEPGVPSRMIEVSVVLDPQTSAPRINIGGVIHAVDPSLRLSAGGLASLFGLRLAPGSQAAGFVDGRLPRELLGVEVRVHNPNGGVIYRASLLYVSPEQINFQMPFEAAGLGSVRVTVSLNGSESPPEGVVLLPAGPGLFVLMDGRAAVLNQDFSPNTPAQPAARGSIVMAFLTGVGPVNPALESGAGAPANPLSFATLPASATIGGVEARVVAVAMVPGYVGLAQANIEIPSGLQPGGYELRVQLGTEVSNGAVVSVE